MMALDGFTMADYIYCRVSEILEILRFWQADSSVGPAIAEGPGVPHFATLITICSDILDMFGPEAAADIDAKRKASNDNMRLQLASLLRAAGNKAGEEIAVEFEVLREGMIDIVGEGAGRSDVVVTNAAVRLLERISAGRDFTPVA
jgi:hypothetical protein